MQEGEDRKGEEKNKTRAKLYHMIHTQQPNSKS